MSRLSDRNVPFRAISSPRTHHAVNTVLMEMTENSMTSTRGQLWPR